MRREHIRIALNEASKLGPHKEFVVVGSLSVLGLKEVPPEMMSMSIDIDFFPFHDQSHIHDIAEVLGEDSAFHEAHGYFLDPIAADVLVLPAGWTERLVLHEFGELRVYFLDVNDTAVSKYVRSADNDFRWLDAGLQSGLLDLDKIDGRSQFGVEYPGDDDKRRIRNGIAAHRAAMRNSGSLRMALLAALRTRPEARIAALIDDDYVYSGPVLFSLDDRIVQEVEHGVVVIHDSSGWERLPEVGKIYTITYRDGTALLESGDL